MKSPAVFIVIYFFASTFISVSAETVVIAIRAILEFQEAPPASEILAIDAAIKNIAPELDHIVESVSGNVTIPPTRHLRNNEQRNLCARCATDRTFCWVFPGIQVPRCTNRSLMIHKELSDESIAKLKDDDKRRHLQVSQLCNEAKTGIMSAINEAEDVGIVPVPHGATFVEECIYEYV